MNSALKQSIVDKLKEIQEEAWQVPSRLQGRIPYRFREKLPWNKPENRSFAKKYADKTSAAIREGVRAMGQEVDETEQMARSFFRVLEAKLKLNERSDPPSKEEVKAAIEQLKDVGRFTVFTTLVILPGGIVSLIGLELLARQFGIKGFNLVPSSFRKDKKNKPSNHPDPSRQGGKELMLILWVLLQLSLPASGQNIRHSKNEIPDEWPQWRGPDRSGNWYSGPELDTLTPDRLRMEWEAPLGSGYSGPTVADGRVYVMDRKGDTEGILAYDLLTGDLLWEQRYPVEYAVGYPTGPRASVLVSRGKAYAWGTMGMLHCLDAANGRILWKINALEQYDILLPTWGLASNPILVDGLLVVMVGGSKGACMVAFDKDTGEEAWRSLDEEASYTAPVLVKQAGKEVLVCWTGESISGLSPSTGEIYWRLPFKPLQMIMNVADPVYDPPYLFLSAFFDGSYLLELSQEEWGARLVYHRHGENERITDALHCCISTPILEDGHVYGIGSYGETRCLDLLTGERLWEDLSLVPKGRWANVHLVRRGNKVWGFNERGELLLGQFSPHGYRDLGRVKVIDPVMVSPNPRNGVCWAHPAFAGSRILVRSDDRIRCLKVRSQ